MEDRPDDRPGRAAPARPEGAGGLRRARRPLVRLGAGARSACAGTGRSPPRCRVRRWRLPTAGPRDRLRRGGARPQRRHGVAGAGNLGRARRRGQGGGAALRSDGEFTAVSCLVAFFFMDEPVRVLREFRRVLELERGRLRDLHDAARGKRHSWLPRTRLRRAATSTTTRSSSRCRSRPGSPSRG